MKALLFALALALTVVPTIAKARTITPPEAKDHVGESVTVEGVVSDVHHAASGNAIFLDMGGHYPDNTFAAVIFKGDFDKFPDVDSLEGKIVDVSGVITLYRGRPEIVVHDPGQIKVK